jgi:hypothetical protein
MTPKAAARPDAAGQRQAQVATLVLACLIALAIALRLWGIGGWNFEATEIFTYRDSNAQPRLTNPRPFIYFLNYYAVRPFIPLDELGLRLLPALFGILAVPAFYYVTRRLVGTRAALCGTLLLTVNPLLIFYSQFARYWSAVFLFSAIYPYAIYLGIREKDRRALAIGLVTGLLAVLAHPVSVLLVGGPAIWLMATYLRPRYLREAWTHRSLRWGALLAVILAVVVTVRLVPVLQSWITAHDKNPGSGQFLLRAPVAPGLKQILYLLAYVESLTLPFVLMGVLGIYLLWHERDRFLAGFLVSLAVFPTVFLSLISLRTPVSTYYLLPTAPVFFIGAGFFLDQLFDLGWRARHRWLLPATLTAVVLFAGAPTLFSMYRNGRRYDFRGVARWLEPRRTPNDIVFSDQPMVLAHYLRGSDVRKLRYDTIPLSRSVRNLRDSGREGATWIVAPAPAHALRTNLKQGGLAYWIYENCQLRNSIGRGRLDFRQQYLEVFQCPPGGTALGTRTDGATSRP